MIHVTKGDMESKSVTIPNIDEQNQIGTFFQQLDNLITLHQRKIEHLQLQKKGLLQQMFV
jgi:type I restriction enzyme S subunit